MKWIPFIALTATTCFAGSLRGVVTNESGLQIASAKVTVFNEIAPLFIQVGKTDANGNYHFKLGAGIYRVIIVKKDYAPIAERISIDKEGFVKNLKHKLLDLKDIDENQYAKILKSIYRQSNRDPFRAMDHDLEPRLANSASAPPSLSAKLTSQSRVALNGETDRLQSIQMGAQLTGGISLETELGQARSASSQIRANYMDADVHFKSRWANTTIQAQTIQNVETTLPGTSKGIGISSHYGQVVRAKTYLRYRQIERFRVESQEVGLSQSANYRFGLTPVNQKIELTAWDHFQEQVGQKADLTNTVTLGSNGNWQTGLDFHYLRLKEEEFTQSGAWIERHFSNSAKSYQSQHRVGLLQNEQGSKLQQIHHISARPGQWEISGTYREGHTIEALSTFDLYGDYIEEPAMRFSLESMLNKQTTLSQITFNLPHASDMESQLSWTRQRDVANVLGKPYRSDLKNKAEYHFYEVSYQLQVPTWGSHFAISHRQHDAANAEFEQLTFKISQWIRPFKDKNRGLRFALQMGNQPNVPGWWLLEETPWDPSRSENWYEGELQLQF